VCSLVIGASSEEQLRQNLGAVDWKLTAEQIHRLDAVSKTEKSYPYGTKTNARNYRLNCFNASFYEIETFIHPAALRMAVHSCKRTKSTGYVHL
jgi:hypothetical protein